MCVVERKTYIYSDNRRDVVESARRCHRAPSIGLCDLVEYKDISPARVVELRPSSSSGRPTSSRDVVTTDRSGRERRYREVTRQNSRRSNAGRTSRPTASQYPMDSATLPPSPTEPTYRETREIIPPAPSPPLPSAHPARASGPRVSFSEPLDRANRTELSNGTAIYRARESLLDRSPLERQSSISSLTNEVDESPLPQRRRSILRRTRPAGLDLNYGASNTTSPSSSPGLSNLPRVGNFPQDSAADLPLSGSQQRPRRPRVDASLDDSYNDHRSQDDDRDTQILRDQLARSGRRRPSRGADDLPKPPRESSRERRRRHRRETEGALEGVQAAENRTTHADRRVADELAQMDRERREKRARESAYSQYPEVPPSPTASRSSRSSYTSYAYTTSPVIMTRQLPSARQVTDTSSPITARAPRSYNVQVHNYPSDPLAERGDQVIARERFRAAEEESWRMADMMGDMDLEAEEVDGQITAGITRSRSRREREERRRNRGYTN